MADPPPFVKLKIVYELPGMDEVQVIRDRPYKSVDGLDLKYDVYLSLGTDQPLPTVVFVHGEGPPEVTVDTLTILRAHLGRGSTNSAVTI